MLNVNAIDKQINRAYAELQEAYANDDGTNYATVLMDKAALKWLWLSYCAVHDRFPIKFEYRGLQEQAVDRTDQYLKENGKWK